ncbi:MAG: peptide-methionine (S)-S-oxide reductase MsrA, partial [Thermoplasmata archaeon]|nr:peptide-methionine (S)-S-oxide reductase MsrA [Thermoplasmata archaeon]
MTATASIPSSGTTEQATIGGGCFWCTEAVFSELRGVVSVFPGYAGGALPNPTYEQVCGGRTGHAEVVQVTFRPSELSYHDLLTIFMTTHDPTTLNQQGNDHGPQYRSIILYHTPEQRATAAATLR